MTRVRKAVIPAAGLGTRFLPATKSSPKEMLPVVDRPAIQYVVEEAVQAGLTDIVIITGRNKRAVEDHFDRNFELEHYLEAAGKHELLKEVQFASDLADIHYVRQRDPLGRDRAAARRAAGVCDAVPGWALRRRAQARLPARQHRARARSGRPRAGAGRMDARPREAARAGVALA